MQNDYKMWLKFNSKKDTLLNWFAFNLACMSNYDLDAHIIIVGKARSGKSTLMLQLVRRILSIKEIAPYAQIDASVVKWLYEGYIYNYPQFRREKQFQNIMHSVIGVDEAFLIADKRKAMYDINVEYTEMLNVFANRNNIVFTNIQDLTELDARVVRKADAIILIKERGLAYLYAKNTTLPIVKQPSIFEFFEKYPHYLNDAAIATHKLKHIKGYIGIMKWKQIPQTSYLWQAYTERKNKLQNEVF